jgi:hypothetical protein
MKISKRKAATQEIPMHQPGNLAMAPQKAPERSFDAYFLQLVGQKTVKKEMKEPIKAHMKAYGFLQSGKFEEGLRHFGIPSKKS